MKKTTQELIGQAHLFLNHKGGRMPNTGDWQGRHCRAWNAARAMPYPYGFTAAIVHMIEAWGTYAEAHRARYGSPIGDDGVLGKAWADAGKALRRFLNGETGALDLETVDGLILAIAAEHGVSEDSL